MSQKRYFQDGGQASNLEMALIEFPQLEDLFDDVTCELSQDKWMRVVQWLKIDTDKLHLIAAAHTCNFQKQKTLGLLCWVEDNPKGATFDKLSNAMGTVGNKKLSVELRSLRRKLLVRKIHTARYQRPQRQLMQPVVTLNQTQKGAPRFEFVKSAMANPVWKLTDPIASAYHSSSFAYLPPRSTSPSFELTSSVSIQGAKLNLIKREAWSERSPSPRKGTRSLSNSIAAHSMPRKRTLGDRNSGSVEITTTIKTAIPLTKATFRDCHPDEIPSKIENKLLDYLLSVNSGGTCTREAGSVVATLETIDGLVVKRLRRASLHIELDIHKPLAAKTLWTHFQNGQLGEMIQEQLISTTALRMSGALAISLETNINMEEFEHCMSKLLSKSNIRDAGRQAGKWSIVNSGKQPNPTPSPRLPSTGNTASMQKNYNARAYTRVTSVPGSRSIKLELSPNVSVVRPGIRKAWKSSEKDKSEFPSISLDGVQATGMQNAALAGNRNLEQRISLEQRPPPPTPENHGQDDATPSRFPKVDDVTLGALEDMHKNIHDAEADYKKFHCDIRRFVDSLNSMSTCGMDKITQVADLRKYATLLRATDAADTALLVEEFIKLTESLEKIHREAYSKVWPKVSVAPTNEMPLSPLKRISVKQQATQALERWREMLEPTFNFSQLSDVDSTSFKGYIEDEEIEKYNGLLSHVPVLIATGKSVYKIFLNYLQAS